MGRVVDFPDFLNFRENEKSGFFLGNYRFSIVCSNTRLIVHKLNRFRIFLPKEIFNKNSSGFREIWKVFRNRNRNIAFSRKFPGNREIPAVNPRLKSKGGEENEKKELDWRSLRGHFFSQINPNCYSSNLGKLCILTWCVHSI